MAAPKKPSSYLAVLPTTFLMFAAFLALFTFAAVSGFKTPDGGLNLATASSICFIEGPSTLPLVTACTPFVAKFVAFTKPVIGIR